MEYTNTHLRRQLVMEMIRYKEFFLPHLTDAISGGYGGKLSADEYARCDKEGLLTAVVRQAYEEQALLVPDVFRAHPQTRFLG